MPSWDKVMANRLAQLKDLHSRRAAGERILLSIPVGLRDLDRNGGIETEILTTIAGPTGEGKSVVKSHLARAAAQSELEVLVLDFEDPAKKTADREYAGLIGLNASKIGRLDLDEDDLKGMEAGLKEVTPWAKRIHHEAGLMTAAQVREALGDHPGVSLVLVDYFQAVPDEGNTPRERLLADLAWDFNMDAQERKRAVAVFSQTVAEIEGRGQARFARDGTIEGFRPGPGKSDLAWARAIGERSKALWYLFRPGRWARAMRIKDAKDDRMEIIVAKANFGTEGTVTVGWNGGESRLYDLKG
jgi:replicative DNA helicase